jgi:hypothetical protein
MISLLMEAERGVQQGRQIMERLLPPRPPILPAPSGQPFW